MIVDVTPDTIEQAASLLCAGELVAMPTETVYGLAADATNASAVEKIFKLKGRPAINPLIVHLATAQEAFGIADFAANPLALARFQKLSASTLMPGPLSCLLPRGLTLAKEVCAGLPTVCIRVPRHPVAQALLTATRLPLAAPSANRSTTLSPSTAQHVAESFGVNAPLILNGGCCEVGLESTVVDLTRGQVQILRPGAITAAQLQFVLGEPVLRLNDHSQEQPASPGLLLTHYRPKNRIDWLHNVERYRNQTIGVVTFNRRALDFSPVEIRFASENGDLTQIAANLYLLIHELDKANIDVILVDRCDEHGEGAAIMDRLSKAIGSLR